MKKSFIKFLGAVALVAGLASSASAAYIVGDIKFGSVRPVALTGGIEGDFSDATGLDFSVATSGPFNGYNAVVNSGTGNFVAELDGLALFKDFTFSPLPLGGAPVWTVQSGNFSFNLTSVSANREDDGLLLSGVGVVSSTIGGLDDTAGTFFFSLQGSKNDASFSWSSNTSSVPEGGAAIALLGLSLLGLEGARRRMKA